MLVADFDYELPEELIAQQPLPDRASSRMLILHRNSGDIEHRSFRDLPSYLRPGDCLIVNDSKVFACRLFGARPGASGKIEVFLLRSLASNDSVWEALVRPGRKLPVGEKIVFSESLHADVIARGEHGIRTIRLSATGLSIREQIEQLGHVPLPPYIRRPDNESDTTRYQTIFARESGSVAAPTAGLHFTPEMVEQCGRAGAAFARVTLHVGLGTFAPVTAEQVADVRLHSEIYSVPPEASAAMARAGRRIAVGTTSVRAIESAAVLRAPAGETSLFITPGFSFRATDALITNFHLPRSSLLMLVSAFAGRELVLEAYRRAIENKYRFFSYGDCMLIL